MSDTVTSTLDVGVPEDVLDGSSRYAILAGLAEERLKELPDCSVDGTLLDPPYGLGTREPTVGEIIAFLTADSKLETGGCFRGKAWEIPSVSLWREVYRVLKPGAHVAVFTGTRSGYLIALGLRAAGFEQRDTLRVDGMVGWVYASGMPHGLDVGKAIDKAAGAEREVVGVDDAAASRGSHRHNPSCIGSSGGPNARDSLSHEQNRGIITAPSTEQAKQWEGWNTALKPCHEDVLLWRKPLQEATVVEQVLATGTGALNVDACRVPTVDGDRTLREGGGVRSANVYAQDTYTQNQVKLDSPPHPKGRWASNYLLVHTPWCRPNGVKNVKSAGGTVIDRTPRNGNTYSGLPVRTPFQSYGGQEGVEEIPKWSCPVECTSCGARSLAECGTTRQCRYCSSDIRWLCQVAQLDGSTQNLYKAGNTKPISMGKRGSVYGAWREPTPEVAIKVPGDEGGASRFFNTFEYTEADFFYCGKAAPKDRQEGLPPGVLNDHVAVKP